MAMYHLSVKYISRKQGRSAVSAAAYRSGEKLINYYNGLTHDFTRKTGIVHTEILLPANAPCEFFDRNTLWNAVEAAERRSDSRTAREVEIALPNELTVSEQIELVRGYVIENFVTQGMCADVALHDGRSSSRKYAHRINSENDSKIHLNNPHAHILLTTRPVGADGFSKKKNRDWDKRENVNLWRERWAKAQNKEFERKGVEIRVSHESYEKQGIDREPTKHLGHTVTELERRNIRTDRGNENRAIIVRNRKREERKYRQNKREQTLVFEMEH